MYQYGLSDLKRVDPQDLHEIQISSRVLGHILDLKYGIKTFITSTLPEALHLEEDNLPVYQLKYVTHQIHLIVYRRAYIDMS